MAISTRFATKEQGQPSLPVAVSVIYHVRADLTYQVNRHIPDTQCRIAIFTLEGQGILDLPDRRLVLPAASLIIVRGCDIRHYGTSDVMAGRQPVWHFWWFQFCLDADLEQKYAEIAVSDPGCAPDASGPDLSAGQEPWPLAVVMAGTRLPDVVLFDQALSALQNGPGWAASAIFTGLAASWVQAWQIQGQDLRTAQFQQAALLLQDYHADRTIQAIAAELSISERTLRNLFYRQAGCSPAEYRQAKRLELAVELLQVTDLRISEIADQLAFTSVYDFSRSFKRHFGVSPSQYRTNRS